MNEISGQVQAVTPQNGVSKRTGKPYTIWTVTVNGQDIKCGFKKPAFEVGMNVTIPVAVNKWGDTEMVESGKAMSGGTPPPRPSTVPATGGGYAPPAPKTFPLGKTHADNAIIRQNALTNANSAVAAYMQHCPAEVSWPDSVEEYADMVIEIAYKFAEFSSGQREVKAVENMGR